MHAAARGLTPWIAALALGLAGASPHAAARDGAAVAPPAADTSFLAQFAATYRFRLGQPISVQPAPGGAAVLFLRSAPRSFVQDLYELDVASGRERRLLSAGDLLRGGGERLSPEERARRERMRVSTRGIVSFQLSEDGRRLLVPLGERLFVVDRPAGTVHELPAAPGFPSDPQLSPDGTRVACVRDGNLHVIDVASGRERRLTTGAGPTLSDGLAEFVAQEEMDRFHGFWWSPDSRRIAYQETDESEVEVLHILDPAHPERTPEARRYPRPGKANARVRLGVVAADGGPTTWVRWDRERHPYLAAVRWTRNAPLTLLVQNRTQTEERLLAAAADGATRTLLVERDRAWLNLDPAMPRWLADGSGFLWTSERSGSWQLERRGRDGRLVAALTPRDFRLRGFVDLDDAAGRAWVLGGDDPTQLHLFRVALAGSPARPERISREEGWHGAVFALDHRLWVHSWSGPRGDPVQVVIDARGAVVDTLRSVAERPTVRPRPRFVTVGARGLRAVILHPADFRAGERDPVIVSVYGGPHVQMVRQSARAYLLEQWLADQGFIVVAIDGRGTPGRGRDWERALAGNLIDAPLTDQVDGLRALGARFPEMDLARAGIFGWSFGGYFTAMATLRRPDVFRAGAAGAPVVDWHDYDTHYTERYLGLPEANPRAYEVSSVLTYAPALERPLLVIHGTTDDNVYFLHTLKLTDALFRAGRKFELLPLAGATHLVPDPALTTRLYGRILDFFREHLAPPPGAGARAAFE